MADGLLYLLQHVDRSLMDEDTLDLSTVPAAIGDTFEQVWLYDRNSRSDSVKILSIGDFRRRMRNCKVSRWIET